MTSPSRSLLALLAALAGACHAPDQELSPSGFVGAEVVTPTAVPAVVLTGTDGAPFDLRAATHGKVSLVFFGYTNCPDICPVHLANLAAVLDKMPDDVQRQVQVIFVTTDPARDSLPRLREYVQQFDRRFIGLGGSDSLIRAAELGFGLSPAVKDSVGPDGRYAVGHAAQVIAVTADGMARVWYPAGTRQRDWAHDLPLLVGFGG